MRAGVVVLLISGCASDPAPFACTMGELTGTWHVVYTETNGNCGRIPDETVSLSEATVAEANAMCTTAVNRIAADKCSIEEDFTCTSQGVKQRWVGTLRQTSDGTLSGSMTVTATGPGLSCRSTYAVGWTRQ